MTNSLGAKPVIDNSEFKRALKEMNTDLRVLESGFRASASSLGNWAKDASGLEMRIKSLNGQMDIQKQKVDATRAEWERIKAEKGENSAAAKKLEIDLNKETQTLNQMGVELKDTEGSLNELQSGSNEAGTAVETLGKNTEETGSKFEGFKSVLGGVATGVQATIGVIAGLAAGVLAVGAAIGGLVISTATASGDLVDLSAKTGISTQTLQEYAFIGGQVGVGLDTITGAHARLIRSMAGGEDGTGAQAEAFKALGISVTDSAGNLRDSQTVFAETLDALGQISNPAERDALAMQIFGKSAQELNPLIKTGSAGMAEMANQAHELGAVMDDETIAAGDKLGDTMDALKAGLKGTLGTLAGAFMPGFQTVFDQLGGYLKIFTGIVSGADGDFGKMATGITGLVTKIASDVAAQAPQMLNAGLSIVKSLLDAITSALPSLLDAGIQIITSLVGFLVQNLPMLLDAGVQILLMLINAIVENLPMLVDAAMQAIIALANGLASALPTLIPAIVQAIILIVNTLLENMPMLVDAALALILGLAEGLIAAIPILIPAIPQIIQAIVDMLIILLPKIGEAALQLLQTLAGGIIENLPLIGDAAVKIIDTLVRGVAALAESLLFVGKSIIEGVWQGIVDNADWFYEQVSGFFSGIIDEAKAALGISSPSKFGVEIGRNFMTSPIIGAQQALAGVESYFADAYGRLARAASVPVGAGNSISNQNDSFQFFAPVIVQGETPANSLGASLKMKRF